MDSTTIGIDASKKKLDIYYGATGKYQTVLNNKSGFNLINKYTRRYYPQVS